MKTKKGTIAIDYSVIGTGRLVLVKNLASANEACDDAYIVRSLTGKIRIVKKSF